MKEAEANIHNGLRNIGGSGHISKGKGATVAGISMKPSYDTVSEASQTTEESQGESIRSVPAQTTSSGTAWAKMRKQDSAASRPHPQANSKSQKLIAFDTSSVLNLANTLYLNMSGNNDFTSRINNDARSYNNDAKHSISRQYNHHEQQDSFGSSDIQQSQEMSEVRILDLLYLEFNSKKLKLFFSVVTLA